jgi:hypothetical protein
MFRKLDLFSSSGEGVGRAKYAGSPITGYHFLT